MRSEIDLEARLERALSQPRRFQTDPVLYRLFEDSADPVNRTSVRGGLRAAVLCFVLFGFFDLWLLPDVGTASIFSRLGVGLFFLGLIEIQVARRVGLRTIHVTCATGLVTASLVWATIAEQTFYQASFAQFLVFGTVFVISSNLFFRLRFSIGATCSSIITLIFSMAALKADITHVAKLITVLYFVTFLGFSLYLSWQLALERYRTFLNSTRARLNDRAVREKSLQLAHFANTDHLTGLRNRRAVEEEYAALREHWLRQGEPIGILLLDVDHFKSFNDHHGHHAGDRCLVEIGRALEATAQEAGGILGRYGGEEFIAFCHVANEDALRHFAETMRAAVEALAISHPRRSDRLGRVTISIGASITRQNASPDLAPLSAEADKALYSAKAKGRNRTHIFDPLAPFSDNEDLRISDLLLHAADSDLISLVYQPIVDMADGSTYAVESLMRLQTPDGESISPSLFIPIAEKTGQIVEIGRWAIQRACTEILVGKVASKVSVNVSPVQLRAPGFPLFIASLIGELKFDPTALALEITEGVDISSDSKILQAILLLQELGVEIWLDDFGTGFAGLSWLDAIDFDLVKIDRRFLHGTGTPKGALLMHDMLRLLKNRGVSIVAEGVETEEHAAFLLGSGTCVAQGYLLCRPVPASLLQDHGPLLRHAESRGLVEAVS